MKRQPPPPVFSKMGGGGEIIQSFRKNPKKKKKTTTPKLARPIFALKMTEKKTYLNYNKNFNIPNPAEEAGFGISQLCTVNQLDTLFVPVS